MSDDLIEIRRVAAVVHELRGYRPAVRTAYQWADVGVRGLRLETTRIGGRVLTRVSWVAEFLDELDRRAAARSEAP